VQRRQRVAELDERRRMRGELDPHQVLAGQVNSDHVSSSPAGGHFGYRLKDRIFVLAARTLGWQPLCKEVRK
jgi:hypothetical protein